MYATWNPEKGQPSIVRLKDHMFIALSEENRDYQDYLLWVAEGNTPEEWQPEIVSEPESETE